ncbi:CBU_0592 family membrane protein [Sphingobium sp. LSP13-1-1.1]|uniref:CBU_0592 family membrane protein n=1 Tax=Sphingobium sp. LSP13-1-1.1 TaxID=3135234 RepID=UPI00342B58E9
MGDGLPILIEIAGWAGALLILGAYLLVSSGHASGRSTLFQGMNTLGSGLFVINTWWHGAIPSTVVNIIWFAIGTSTLVRIARR